MNTLQLSSCLASLAKDAKVSEFLERIKNKSFPLDCSEMEHGLLAMLIAAALRKEAEPKRQGRHFLILVPSDLDADAFASNLNSFGIDSILLPWWKTAAYRAIEPGARIYGERTAAMARILDDNGPRVVISSLRACLLPMPPRSEFEASLYRIKVGKAESIPQLSEMLVSWGYLRVPKISLEGEFAIRGEVLDIWMPGDENALRIVFSFDEVEEIRRFDPASQMSLSERPKTLLLRPIRELVWTDAKKNLFIKGLERLADSSNGEHKKSMESILLELETKNEFTGQELYYPMAWDKAGSLFDYLDNDSITVFVDSERIFSQREAIIREYDSLYKKALFEKPVIRPMDMLADFEAISAVAKNRINIYSLKDREEKQRLRLGSEPARSYFGNINYFREELGGMTGAGYKVHVFAENLLQAERIRGVLKEFDVNVYENALTAGFSMPESKLVFITESEIFGRRKRLPKSLKSVKSRIIDTFIELNPGDYVVHLNYGIGRFTAIERLKVLGNDRDYIKIEYRDDENVFVPIEQANLVQRYIGNEGEAPRLDSIGSKSWENRKSRVKKSVEDLAERLIRIYSRRKMARGFQFPPDTEWQNVFEAAFPWEETPDQLTSIHEVKADMESEQPMDRLLCGDVGYGKTEIAMRAIFKAVLGGKQAAFLAPTTILAEQHYNNCLERFRGFPVNFALLSRFVDRSTQKKAIKELEEGKVDVVIGTHRMLQKDVRFRDLGLLVVDEEQRFGVKDKERLKELKSSVDCLTMTATPIPRTLHMSMLKIRDMSVLTTPPNNRYPIRTVVEEFRADLIANAIRQEMERGGQVFYLHNRIESLHEVHSFLLNLVPEAMVEIAHGRLDGKELEDIMYRFVHNGFHILLSTTIIENGIDIPNVNTIIIDRADMYGISQLYQLRGRVGRSDRPAYAWLFYPDGRALSELAMKRLQIISDFTELGSGFKISMKDLEVRGAGNLLGREQSGDIYSVGFDLYLKLLDEAVAKLSSEGYDPEEEPYLELDYTGFIPESYIPQQAIKMEIYKKIASILGRNDLDSLYLELEDRFGPIPEEVSSLLALAEIRILCKKLSIASLREKGGFVMLEFMKVARIQVEKLLRLIKESGQKIKLDPERPNVLLIATGPIGLKEKSEYIREKLTILVE